MLRIYVDAIKVIRLLEPVLGEVKSKNANLADQCDRAATSVALNLSEGSGQRAGNRRLRYQTALGEARELWGACDIIEAKRLSRIGCRSHRVTLLSPRARRVEGRADVVGV